MNNPKKATSFVATLTDAPNFKISVGWHTWLVHSDVLKERSGYFRRMLSSEFKEAAEKSITLQDENPENVARLIMTIYFGIYTVEYRSAKLDDITLLQMMEGSWTGNESYVRVPTFDVVPDDSCEHPDEIKMHLEMFMLGDKYDCESAKTCSSSELEYFVAEYPDRAENFDQIYNFVRSYGAQAGPILDVIVDVVVDNPTEFLSRNTFLSQLQEEHNAGPTLVAKLLERLSDTTQSVENLKNELKILQESAPPKKRKLNLPKGT